MQADDVGCGHGGSKEYIVEGDQGSIMPFDVSFPFLEAERGEELLQGQPIVG